MGREVHRVPVDFDWPTNKIWPGFCYRTPDCGIESCPDAEDTEVPWSVEDLCAFHRALWDCDEYPELAPPTGTGWQVWETVSEGSPISPVFPDREGLIGWLMSPAYSWGVSQPLTRAQAENFTADGWAPTFIFSAPTGLVNGEQFIGGQ